MSDEQNKWEQVVALVESLKTDAAKCFSKNNKSAGLRLRKGLMQLRELAKQCRVDTLNLK